MPKMGNAMRAHIPCGWIPKVDISCFPKTHLYDISIYLPKHVTKMSRERDWNWLCSIILLSCLLFLPQSFSILSLLNVLNLRLLHLKLSLTFSKYILHFKWHETFVLLWFWPKKMYFLIHITRVSHVSLPAIIYYGIQQNWNSLSEHNLGLEFERTWSVVLSTFLALNFNLRITIKVLMVS